MFAGFLLILLFIIVKTKKEPVQVLDLSRVKITSKDDFKRCLDKIPECKVKPEKILPDQVKIKDKDFTFVSGKKEEKQAREWSYPDPMPSDMKGVRLEDICPINIDWKMLTTQRPKSKVEEEFFSRLVQLGKLDLKYQQSLRLQKSTDWIRRTKNPKSSIVEMRVLSCKECGEDFCDGSACSKLTYENFFRPQSTTADLAKGMSLLAAEFDGKPSKRKKKRKQKRKRKTGESHSGKGRRGRKKLGKSSIFNRPASVGCTRDHFREKGVKPEKRHKFRSSSLTRSRSFERTRHDCTPKRSKSAPRIHFDFDTPANSDSECRRRDYVSDSAPSNTDYSTQSDTESAEAEESFFSPRLRLSGRRKLLSARVSFANKKEHKEPTGFVRRCTLGDKHRLYGREKFGATSARSLPSRSSEKVFSKFSSFSLKAPATIQIELDDEFSTGDGKLSKIALPVTPVFLKKTYSSKKKETDLKKRAKNAPKFELFVSGDNQTSQDKNATKSTRKSKVKINHRSLRSDFFSPECCLKAQGLFKKRTQ